MWGNQELSLPPRQGRIYAMLRQKAGDVVPYDHFESVISCKKDRNQLAAAIYQMRKRGVRIENVSGVGYRLRPKRRKAVQVYNTTPEAQLYAQDVQEAIHGVMRKHADNVGFESQVAIMGVAIGALLHQLPTADRDYFTKILVRNVKDANKVSKPMSIN